LYSFFGYYEHMFVSLETLSQRRRELDALEAAWLNDVAAYDRSDDWRAEGYVSAAAAIRVACNMNTGAARGHVDLARKLEDLPQVADAFGRGEISARHAVVVANAYTPERAAAISDVEAELVDVARRHTPRELGGVVRYLMDAIDGDGGAVSDEAVFERRRLHLSSTLDSMLAINGICDPATAEILLAAVNAEMAQDHQDLDGRLPAQRRMDAFINLGRRSLDRGELGESRNVRPHVTVVVDLDELPGNTPELVAKVRTERRHNGHLSATTLERLTCDCDISRVITTGRSEIQRRRPRHPQSLTRNLESARRTRPTLPSPRMRPTPDSCEAHHVVHWTRGGPTNLENLQLLCWNHHRYRHTHDAQARAA
jgi:hypothetical protein